MNIQPTRAHKTFGDGQSGERRRGLVDGSQRCESGASTGNGRGREVSRAHRQRFAWILSGNEVGRWTRGDRQREYTMPQERRNALILIVAPRTRPPVTVAVEQSGEPRERLSSDLSSAHEISTRVSREHHFLRLSSSLPSFIFLPLRPILPM